MIYKVWSFRLGVAALPSNCCDFLASNFLFLSCGFNRSRPLRSTGKRAVQKVRTVSKFLKVFFSAENVGALFSVQIFHFSWFSIKKY